MDGNARFEGFAIDLFKHISEFLQFNVTYKIVDDGSYGSMDEHGNWNGMIREVMDGVQEGGMVFFLLASHSSEIKGLCLMK